MDKTYFNWSTGKDSALALYHLQKDGNYSVERLLTSVNAAFDRVSMHGLRRELLERQISALHLPCTTIELPESPSMETYEAIMIDAVTALKKDGYTTAAFGDIFLEDLKEYRIAQLKKFNLHAIFPLWKRNTDELMQEFLSLGFKSIVVCVNAQLLDASFVGRVIDQNFLDDLPKNVDPCGENGEFHTFCFEGPIFNAPIPFEVGEKIYREYPAPNEASKPMGFWFCDLI